MHNLISSKKLIATLLLVHSQALLPAAAWTGEPPTNPILRIETGVHTAPIQRIATDRSGQWAVTVSGDKSARIWETSTRKPLGILRVPQNNYEDGVFGEDGQLAAVAISPNGTEVAVAGYTGRDWNGSHSIYIFSRLTQKMERHIPGFKNTINHLAYSSDGRWIAAAIFANGIKIIDAKNGREVGSDIFAGDSFGASSYSVEFSPPDKLGNFKVVSTNNFGEINLYEISTSGIFRPLKSTGFLSGTPIAARFSPDGNKIAVGFKSSNSVTILSAHEL